jgi:ADP-ribosylglycohydrolase
MPSLIDRFLGCMLGHAVGDAVAAPYESMDAQTIYYSFGSTHDLVEEPLQAELCYTDDT